MKGGGKVKVLTLTSNRDSYQAFPFIFNQPIQKANDQQNYRQKKEGDVTIHFEAKKNNKHDNQVGEYVDYEEIKD